MKKLFHFDPKENNHISKMKEVAVSYAKTEEEAALFIRLFTSPIEDVYHRYSSDETLYSVRITFNAPHGKYQLSLFSDNWHSNYTLCAL